MTYGRLAERLRGSEAAPTVTALPDGSVDEYCRLSVGGDTPVDTREAFVRALTGDREAFRVRRESVEPGGQAVNVARQARALGGDATLYGHLDDPLFDDLPFEARSMGAPSRVSVLQFDDGDAMLSTASPDADDWSLDDLRAVADLSDALTADAVFAGNWISFPRLGDALRELGDAGLDGGTFVFDPGDVDGFDPDRLTDLGEALAALTGSYDVVVSANEAEIRALAGALGGGGDGDGGGSATGDGGDADGRLRVVREATGVAAAVAHGVDRAAASTPGGVVSVPNLAVDAPARRTGGGDRFDAGLAHARALGWDWELALALGNACSSYYVDRAETGAAAALAEFCDERRG